MATWRKAVAGVALVLFLLGAYFAPYLASYRAASQATQAAIKSAQAAQNSEQDKTALAKVQQAEDGIQQLLQFVASVQKNPNSTQWFVLQMQAICAALPDCHQVPLPAK